MVLADAVKQIYPDAVQDIDFIVGADPETLEQYFIYFDEDKYQKPTQEELEAAAETAEQERARQEEIQYCLDYLNRTDFYFIRSLDSGKPVPVEVQEERDRIRARMLELGL